MSAKTDRPPRPTAQQLARELKADARRPGFLARLCRWEQQRSQPGRFTLQHRRD